LLTHFNLMGFFYNQKLLKLVKNLSQAGNYA